jgi:predicted patatin/cPLA2 family phospholipase
MAGGRNSMTRIHVFLTLILCQTLLCGCASQPRAAFTNADQMAAVPIGGRSIRFWADAPESIVQDAARRAVVQKGKPFAYLALSGGGGGGAYGAGVLNGWSKSGMRPEFTVVSGVSVGAMIAPFAFLGPIYDERLKQIYTNGEAQGLIDHASPLGAIFGGGLIESGRMREMVERYIDDEMLDEIAREDRKGRRLLVVTTDLDAQRAVIWDMGAIAATGGPRAFKLFRDVLAASASVPVVFAPQLIEVEANDRRFQEMHVDGAVTAPVFILPDTLLLGGKSIVARGGRQNLYVIVNARLDAGFQMVPNEAEAIAARSFGVMNRVDTEAVLAQTYKVAARDGLGFNLSYIGKDIPESGGSGFETDTMRRLFNDGYEKASAGSFWENKPPQVETAKAMAKTPER